jgi:arabinose-5-phosphate isomerase
MNRNTNTTINTIKNVLSNEAQALFHLSENLDDSLVNIIDMIFQSRHRLVITGIGKSAIVGQKIVATLNSTGTNALFMHAADAIHGDLGMVVSGDIVMCISKSGETPEIKGLIPLIKSMGNTVIGMTSSVNSVLAKQCDFLISIPMNNEADPNNLAPTTSTTLQMAMGDAIAIALLQKRGFTAQQFAKFHPGGNLGKKLYLKVADIVDKSNRPRVYTYDPISKVILEISSKRYGATAVLDDNENLLGIITDGDLRRMLEYHSEVSNLTALDIVQRNPSTIQRNAMAVEALQILKEKKIQQLLVLDGIRYFGVIHFHELSREGIF